jgi:hypothetical protein
MKFIGVGALFENHAKSDFLRLTGSRYDAMKLRIERHKKLPDLPFTKDEFRAHVLKAMNGNQDGVVVCRYCNQVTTLHDLAADHEMPIDRGGSLGLENIGFPCQSCNRRKNRMTPDEFLKLLNFLEKEIPMARMDVLDRLEKAISLVIGLRRNAPIVSELKESGEWGKVQDKRRRAYNEKQQVNMPQF